MKVREVMTNHPACCTPDASLQEVARMMVENDCGCIPVVDSKLGMKPIGTITDRDITVRTVAGGQNPLQMKASDVMSIDIVTIKPNASLEECFKAMEERDIRRILVVDDSGKCCGIVAQADVVQSHNNPVRTAEFLREISESSPSHNMTMSKDYKNNQSYLSTGYALPILLGIGSGAALAYYFGQRKTGQNENNSYQTAEHQSTTARQPVANHYIDADDEVDRRKRNLENRVQELKTGIQAVTESVGTSGARFEVKTSTNGKFHFTLKAGNGQTILSSELYNSRIAAEKGIESVKKNAAAENRYERKVNKKQEPYFVLKAGNGEVIGMSEAFSSETAMESGISSVMKNAPMAEISTTAS